MIFLTSTAHYKCLRKRGKGRCVRLHLFKTPFSRQEWLGLTPSPERVLACLALYAITTTGYPKRRSRWSGHYKKLPFPLSELISAYQADYPPLDELPDFQTNEIGVPTGEYAQNGR